MNRYSIHAFDGTFLTQSVEAPDHAAALVLAATRDLTRFDGSPRPEQERIFAPDTPYIVSDERGPSDNGRVRVLKLREVPLPQFEAVRV